MEVWRLHIAGLWRLGGACGLVGFGVDRVAGEDQARSLPVDGGEQVVPFGKHHDHHRFAESSPITFGHVVGVRRDVVDGLLVAVVAVQFENDALRGGSGAAAGVAPRKPRVGGAVAGVGGAGGWRAPGGGAALRGGPAPGHGRGGRG